MLDQAYWIWFQLMFGFGTRRSHLMLNYFSSPKALFEGIENNPKIRGMLTEEEANYKDLFIKAENIKNRTLKKGAGILCPDSPMYPSLLNEIYAKPAALYYKGDISFLNRLLCITFVGARDNSSYGEKAAAYIISGLKNTKTAIISGLAKGIDSIAHISALENSLKTVGILGCGIDIDYPAGSAPLKKSIAENGAVITEYPLGMEPRPHHFPIRNRIIAGVSHGTVVIEGTKESGSIITANHALEQGREVFALPGSIFSRKSGGTNALIRDGAHICENGADILNEFENYKIVNILNKNEYSTTESELPDTALKPESPKKKRAPKKRVCTVPEHISQEGKMVLEIIKMKNMTAEELAEMLDLGVCDILSALTELELYSVIECLPGRKFALM